MKWPKRLLCFVLLLCLSTYGNVFAFDFINEQSYTPPQISPVVELPETSPRELQKDPNKAVQSEPPVVLPIPSPFVSVTEPAGKAEVESLKGPSFDPQERETIDDVAPKTNTEMRVLTDRVANLERRVAEVERKLEALVTVQKSTGETVQKRVEIDVVHGYGAFEVPAGGKVVAVNGVPVNRSSVVAIPSAITPVYQVADFALQQAAPRSSVIRIVPMRRSLRGPSCSVDPVTGQIVCGR